MIKKEKMINNNNIHYINTLIRIKYSNYKIIYIYIVYKYEYIFIFINNLKIIINNNKNNIIFL